MSIDHIFIFIDDDGKIADELVEFSFTEGSNRIHAGQGTTNRKFYFENFFLEILWVHDEKEIKSETIEPIGLWKRAAFNVNNYSPFGLCLVNYDKTDQLFEHAFKYQPEYFPKGNTIDILMNDHQKSLPWTFRLPFKGQKQNTTEPTKHKNRIGLLSKAIFEHQEEPEIDFLDHFQQEKNIAFIKSNRIWLNLIFDNAVQGQRKDFELLKLTIRY